MRFIVFPLLFLLTVSAFSYAVATKDSQAQRQLIIVDFRGQIDRVSLASFYSLSQTFKPGQAVLIVADSPGGYLGNTMAWGRLIVQLRDSGIPVYFYAISECASGCFILSSFATATYEAENTSFGFHHAYQDVAPFYQTIITTLYVNRGVTNASFFPVMDAYLNVSQAESLGMVQGVVPLSDFRSDYSVVSTVVLMADTTLGAD